MSYILDALKKADQQRSLGDVPDLEATHWGERHKRSWRWIWVLAALLLVNGALLFMLLGRNAAELSGDDGLSRQADSAPLVALPQRDHVATPPPVETSRPREPVYVPALPAKRPTRATQAPLSRVTRAPLPLDDDTPAPAFSPPVTPVQAPVAASGVPEWNDMSLEFRSGFTLPHIDVHVYSDDPGRRFILVELRKYREGETLDSGAVLEEILPDSIQLFYQGTRFRVEK